MLIWMALVASHLFVCFIGMVVGAISEDRRQYHNRFKRESIPLQRALEASGLDLPIIESTNGQPYLEGTVTNDEHQVLIQNVRKEIADAMINRAMGGIEIEKSAADSASK
jgi:hypothetical protein